MATSLKARAMLTLAYGCALRAGEVVRLRAGAIDSEQMIIRIMPSKGSKDRHVMLPAEVPNCCDDGGRRGRAHITSAARRNSAGWFQVAVISL
jgi:site-specific recombinase XerD